MSLDGQVAAITGGGTGLGAACARTLGREGATVVVSGRRQDKLDTIVREIEDSGGRAVAVAGDVSEPKTSERIAAVTADLGGASILVNNAGLHAEPNLVHEVPVEEWDRFTAVNLRGPFLMMRALIPQMIARGGGSVVNVASIFGMVGFKNAASYCATKGGVVQLTRATALDYGADEVRVNCICPGHMEPVERRDTSPEQQAKLLEGYKGVPLDRTATTDEVADLVLFLAGPSGAAMTGAIIPVDSGYTAH